MRRMTALFIIGLALLLGPWNAHASNRRVYVGVGVGTAVAIGGGIVSFNVGYSQQVNKQKPESSLPGTDRPPALAELKRKREDAAPHSLTDFEVRSQSASPQPLRIELPFFILRW